MKKRAFTIAEILITLGIVGVVAALTIPQITTESKKQLYANTLSVAVVDLETAMTTMTMREGVDTLYETEAWKSNFLTELKKVMPYKHYSKAGTLSRASLDVPNSEGVHSYNYFIETKKGVAYYISINSQPAPKSENEIMLAGGNLISQAGFVSIDINARNKPNMWGRDTFTYVLGADGHLYPEGGKDVTIYNGKTYSAGDAEKKCKTDRIGNACAAYLAENGYKMDY